MVGSLRSLFSGIIDYAGLLPPAELPLEAALRNYAGYLMGEQAWMLSHFVCPAERLPEIEAYAEALFGSGQPQWRFSVLGRGGYDIESFLENLQGDLLITSEFVERREGAALVDVIEVKLPLEVIAAGEDEVIELAERAAAVVVNNTKGHITPHYEMGFDVGDPSMIAAALTGLKRFNDRWTSQSYPAAGAKLYTGGPESSVIPSCNQVAFFVSACRNLELAFKAASGFPRAIRGFDEAAGVKLHGFINLFAAAAMSYALQVDLQTLVEILECEASEYFEFSDELLKWRVLEVPKSEIVDARSGLCLSFGCSYFEEPVGELKQLGVL